MADPTLPEDPILRVEQLCKRFGELVVLDHVSFNFARGKTTAIIGPSGTGKSVLLKHIVGLMPPDSGHIWMAPKAPDTRPTDMANASEAEKYRARRRIGMLFQDGALFDSLSVGENIGFPLNHHTSLSDKRKREIVQEKLELVELPGIYDRRTSELSGGQRKRVGLARAIVMEPEVVLFDEPNSGLDPLTSDTIDELIGRMKQQLGITFIVITHDIVSCMNIADYVGMLFKGQLVEFGTTDHFIHSPKEVVRRFLKRNVSLPDLPANGQGS